MAGHGFIHDKLEIKFLILYIVSRLIEPVPFEIVLDLTMCDDGIDYFDFSECLRDLVKTGQLTLSSEGLYAITEQGARNGAICESSLPYSVRLLCDKNLDIQNRKLRRKSQVRASYEKRPNGTYSVRLALDDDMGSVLDMTVMALREDVDAEEIYRLAVPVWRCMSRSERWACDEGKYHYPAAVALLVLLRSGKAQRAQALFESLPGKKRLKRTLNRWTRRMNKE